MSVCLHVCLCTICLLGACEDQEKVMKLWFSSPHTAIMCTDKSGSRLDYPCPWWFTPSAQRLTVRIARCPQHVPHSSVHTCRLTETRQMLPESGTVMYLAEHRKCVCLLPYLFLLICILCTVFFYNKLPNS